MDIMITSRMLKVFTSVSEIQDIFESRNRVFFNTSLQSGIMSFSAMCLHSLKPWESTALYNSEWIRQRDVKQLASRLLSECKS